jgi:hypothetical protein
MLKRGPWGILACLLLAHALAFGLAYGAVPMVGDDWYYYLASTMHGAWGALAFVLKINSHAISRPIEALSQILAFKVLGIGPLANHLFNFLLYAIDALLMGWNLWLATKDKALVAIVGLLAYFLPGHVSKAFRLCLRNYLFASAYFWGSLICFQCAMERRERVARGCFRRLAP